MYKTSVSGHRTAYFNFVVIVHELTCVLHCEDHHMDFGNVTVGVVHEVLKWTKEYLLLAECVVVAVNLLLTTQTVDKDQGLFVD